MESYDAYKQVDPRSPTDVRAQEKFETTTLQKDQRYNVGVLWDDDNNQIRNNYFPSPVQLKSLERRLSRDTTLN